MGRVAFICDMEEGHFFPTFGLAHTLKERGHDIYYISIRDNQMIIEDEGFLFYPLFEDLYPKGFKERFKKRALLPKDEWKRENNLTRKTHIGYIGTNDAYRFLLKDIKADLVFISFYLPFDIMVLYYKYNIRPILVVPILRELNKSISYFFEQYVGSFGVEEKCYLLDFLRQFDIEFDSLSHVIEPLNSLSEIIVCPGELDFDQPILKDTVIYTEPFIRKGSLSFDVYETYKISRGKKIIYASMGSQSIRHRYNCDLFYGKAVNIMKYAEFEHMHLILCVGREYDKSKLNNVPENVTVLNWGPQIDILKSTSVAIIHGGLGGVKECIYYGVPMIIFPQGYDQPRNARRIKYHKLGFSGDITTVSETELKSYILDALTDDTIKSQVQKMQKIFREKEEQQAGANIIESILSANRFEQRNYTSTQID